MLGDVINPRIERFRKAFSYMFDDLRYKKITNVKNRKKIVFEQFEKQIYIEELSSGEKQIVFRGGILLRNQKSNKDIPVLIDEPEISLHPNWQLRIMDFYKELFKNDMGVQTSQIIVATHSPFIIHNKKVQDKVIILKKDDEGIITVDNFPQYYNYTKEDYIHEAFNLNNIFVKNDGIPVVFVEGETDIKYITKAGTLLEKEDLLRSVELRNANGEGGLNNIWKSFDEKLSIYLQEKIILLYDCETSKPQETRGKLYRKKITMIDENPVKKGIENLFSKEVINMALAHKPAFFDITSKGTKSVRGVETTVPQKIEVNKDEKGNLCDWLIENGTAKDFENFKNVFDIIEGTIN